MQDKFGLAVLVCVILFSIPILLVKYEVLSTDYIINNLKTYSNQIIVLIFILIPTYFGIKILQILMNKVDYEEEVIRPTRAWYLVSLFLGIIGGIIGYFALKDKDLKMANKVLILGIFTIFIWVFIALLTATGILTLFLLPFIR